MKTLVLFTVNLFIASLLMAQTPPSGVNVSHLENYCTAPCITTYSPSVKSPCYEWRLWYNKNCVCEITEYVAVYYVTVTYPSYIAIVPSDIISDATNPEFLGIDVNNLGCYCEYCAN